jgi:tetratricopeptide (TPR) repeat protein
MEGPEQPQSQSEPGNDAAATASGASRIIGRIITWTAGSRLRMAMSAVAGLTVLGANFAVWSYFGQVALEELDPESVEAAIAALDEGRFGDAKSLVGQMQQQPAAPELLGGALFVLGAVKSHEALEEVAPGRRREMHEIASRYLQKAHDLGVPGDRQGRAAFMLGQSLALSGQWDAAIAALTEALRDSKQPATEIHKLLATANREKPEQDLPAALKHNELVLADASLSPEERDQAWIVRAEALLNLGRLTEAAAVLDKVTPGGAIAARRTLLLGRLEVEAAAAADAASSDQQTRAASARTHLEQVLGLDAKHGALSRQAALWLARLAELEGDREAALEHYDRLSKTQASTPEGLAAALAAADCYRREGQLPRALAACRSVLREIAEQGAYESTQLPQAEVRRRLSTMYQQCLEEEQFAEALSLVELLEPVFGRVACTELRAKTRQQWGRRRLEQSHGAEPGDLTEQSAGRRELRAAGKAFEELAQLRFASRHFSDDLWESAECYFEGQSYTHAARVLRQYLHHEAKIRNATALLRLGQAHLATGQYAQSIAALEECMEMFPHDAVVHQARLECARAYRQDGQVKEAEAMLLENLVGGNLTPQSVEWRDSLFALGDLLYGEGRLDECISKLQEAVERYPDAEQTLLAKYTIARAYHIESEQPAERIKQSKTENERLTARARLEACLASAYEYYLDVQKGLVKRQGAGGSALDRSLLRNCYLLEGSVLYELRRFEEALQAYGSVITSFQNDPIALESFVQVANCWRRLDQPVKARVTLDQARMVLKGMPADADFLTATNFNRQQWEVLLSQMSNW